MKGCSYMTFKTLPLNVYKYTDLEIMSRPLHLQMGSISLMLYQ